MNCKLCAKYLSVNLTPLEIMLWQPIKTPQICLECLNEFEEIKQRNACQSCGKKDNYKICKDCKLWQNDAEYGLINQAMFCYDTNMKLYMQKYKFEYDLELANVFKHKFTKFLKITGKSIVIPIPQRATERKFNQVTTLIDNSNNIKSDILLVSHAAIDNLQVNLNRKERLQQPQPFELNVNALRKIVFEKIILVDDIYTTGRTLRHAANLIAQYTAKPIIAKTLAR